MLPVVFVDPSCALASPTGTVAVLAALDWELHELCSNSCSCTSRCCCSYILLRSSSHSPSHHDCWGTLIFPELQKGRIDPSWSECEPLGKPQVVTVEQPSERLVGRVVWLFLRSSTWTNNKTSRHVSKILGARRLSYGWHSGLQNTVVIVAYNTLVVICCNHVSSPTFAERQKLLGDPKYAHLAAFTDMFFGITLHTCNWHSVPYRPMAIDIIKKENWIY